MSGGSPLEVSCFIGKEYEDFQCDGTFPTIMSKGFFRLKAIVASGETNQDKVNKIDGKVLGLGWKPYSDTLYSNLNVSLTTSNKEKLHLSVDTMEILDTNLLTPRNLLRIVNGIYDPLGLVAFITTRLRTAFCDLFCDGFLLNGMSLFHLVQLKNCGLT